MTRAEINAQYTRIAGRMGDLAFRLEDLERTVAAVRAEMGELRKRRAELEKLAAEINDQAPASTEPVEQGASNAVEPSAV